MAILDVKNLTVVLENQLILDNLSFSVEKGDIVAVIGPNGAGKTTLFKTIMGFLPYRGSITWQKGIKAGYAPQGLDINRQFPLTVEELLRFSSQGEGRGNRDSKSRTEALAKVNVAHLLHRSMTTLSSGEFQRVLIARALFEKPDVLLFDEPTSDIDIGGQETIYTHLEHIAKTTGLTVLLISHDLSVVYRYATKVICLNRDLKCEGPPLHALTPETIKLLYGQEVHFHPHRPHHAHAEHEN